MVLIDVPPLGTSYGIDLARASQNLLLVVPYLDPVRYHTQLKERLDIAGIRLLGYAFNGVPVSGTSSPTTRCSIQPPEPFRKLDLSFSPRRQSRSSGAAYGATSTEASMPASTTTTAVREDEAVEYEDQSGFFVRDDDTLIVPTVRGRTEPETQVPGEPATGPVPVVDSEPATQEVPSVDDAGTLE